MKVAYLWGQWTGYMTASTAAIAKSGNAEIRVLLPHPKHDAQSRLRPFILDALQPSAQLTYTGYPRYQEVKSWIDEFDPQVVVVSGWNYQAYMRVLREGKGRFLRALSMDNQWLWKLKQIGGVAASRIMVRPCFDMVFASGPRQRQFAEYLGFHPSRIFEGYLSCDVAMFSSDQPLSPTRRFVFAGRLTDDKGIEQLLKGHQRYREHSSYAWPLEIVGTGPLEHLVPQYERVTLLPFKQPRELAQYFKQGGTFVLPSAYEPWGVVLHEAASAGMPLIASRKVGAGDMFLRHGWNGLLIDSVSPDAIATAMHQLSSFDDSALLEFGSRSEMLAQTLTPQIWADTFWRAVTWMRGEALNVALPAKQLRKLV